MMQRKPKKSNRLPLYLIIALVAVSVFSFTFYRVAFGDNNAESFSYKNDTDDFVKIMDVGQGDSILIYSNGYSALVDAGLNSYSGDICADLEAVGIKKLDAVLITHLHTDHTGALSALTTRYKIDNLILPIIDTKAEAASTAISAKETVIRSGGNVFTATQGLNFDIGEFEITVLAYYSDMKNENNQSIVAMAEIDGLKFLLTGDAESEVERAMINEGLNLDCDVLKVGHHGSNSSSCSQFLKKASPTYSVISVGRDNMYSLPSKKVTDSLKKHSSVIYRTDKQGDITFFAEKGKLRVEAENN